MAQKKRPLAFTGGGTAGHVMPALGALRNLRDAGESVIYFGDPGGIEREMITPEGVPYLAVPTGKLRRYFDLKNFTDPFRIVFGIVISLWHMLRLRPRALFSGGGFTGIPPIIAAWLTRVPIIILENDRTPGLANKIALRFAAHVCVANPKSVLLKTTPHLTTFTGPVLRGALFEGTRDKGLALAGFDGTRPVLLVVGGSLGAKAINEAVWAALPALTARYDVLHICGGSQVREDLAGTPHYTAFEFLRAEFPHALAAADYVLSRAGAGALAEFIALEKPHLVVPLPLSQSRGDQIENAQEALSEGTTLFVMEEDLTAESLAQNLAALEQKASALKDAMAGTVFDKGGESLTQIILQNAR